MRAVVGTSGAILSGLLALLVSTSARGDDGPLRTPADEFLIIPLRVHVLAADGLPEIDCALTDADIRRIVGKVNGVWRPAGIYWALDPIVREPAAKQAEFKAAREPGDGPRPKGAGGTSLGLYRMLAPRESRAAEGMNVYYLHAFSVNGVYLGNATAFVQETAKLRAVEGGIDEPLPRVTAHELGHALGLPHRQDRTNLLASGTTGTSLNAEEVATARKTARATPGAREAPEVRKAAEAAEASGDKALARRLWSTLAEIPGPGADEAARRRDALPANHP